jgi:hypothetical protein
MTKIDFSDIEISGQVGFACGFLAGADPVGAIATKTTGVRTHGGMCQLERTLQNKQGNLNVERGDIKYTIGYGAGATVGLALNYLTFGALQAGMAAVDIVNQKALKENYTT